MPKVMLEKIVYSCSSCGEEIEYCYSCRVYFEEGEEISCEDGEHLHKKCQEEQDKTFAELEGDE